MLNKIFPRTAIPISTKELRYLVQRTGKKEVSNFEKKIQDYLAVRKVIATDSGRSALLMALKSLNLKKGEKVLLPAFTCPILYNIIISEGLIPLPVDVSLKTNNIDINTLKTAYRKDTRTLILVHLFGKPCEMDEIMEFTSENNIFLIEDAAQALGSKYRNKKIGTFGDLSILSFGLGKVITGGGGGSLIINNEEHASSIDKIENNMTYPNSKDRLNICENILGMKMISHPNIYSVLRNYVDNNLTNKDIQIIHAIKNKKQKNKYNIKKIHPLSAKIVNSQLENIKKINQTRLNNSKKLIDLLKKQRNASIPTLNTYSKNVFTRFPIRVLKRKKRSSIVNKLIKQGIDVEKPYYSLNKILMNYSNVPNSINLARSLITIPNHACLSCNDISLIGKKTLSILQSSE
jgi:perosamine synthetase